MYVTLPLPTKIGNVPDKYPRVFCALASGKLEVARTRALLASVQLKVSETELDPLVQVPF